MGGGRKELGVSLAVAVVVLVFMAQTSALGYQNQARHYTLDAPSGWTQTSLGGVDVAFYSPTVTTDGASFNVISIGDPGAKNTGDYVLQYARGAAQVLSNGGATILTQPQATTIAGRPAAEYKAQNFVGSLTLTVRQVVFASESYHIVYAVTLAALGNVFDSMTTTWNSVLNSFKVIDEPAPAPPLGGNSLLIFGLIGAVAAAVILVVVLVVARRRRKAVAMLPPSLPPVAQPVLQTVEMGAAPPPSGQIQELPPPPLDSEEHPGESDEAPR